MFMTNKASENEIQIFMKVNLFKTQYLPEEYSALKELFNLIIAKTTRTGGAKETTE